MMRRDLTALVGAYYDGTTSFPSGDTDQTPPWGLDGGASPWEAGMRPVPEPSLGIALLIGAPGLAGMRGGAR